MRIREFSGQDLNAILAIQKGAGETAQWQPADYEYVMHAPGGLLLVAEVESDGEPAVVGFAAVACVLEEAEVQNLAVHPEHRRRGVARALLEALHQRLRQTGVKVVYLEVRPSNHPAQALYHQAGYTLRGRRPSYYDNPVEDALVLSRSLGNPP